MNIDEKFKRVQEKMLEIVDIIDPFGKEKIKHTIREDEEDSIKGIKTTPRMGLDESTALMAALFAYVSQTADCSSQYSFILYQEKINTKPVPNEE